MPKRIIHNQKHDQIDRRGFLECMAWAGTGVVWTVSGGVLSSRALGQSQNEAKGELHFVQISDSHIGFNRPANPDVSATLQIAIDRINDLPQSPEFVIHTGDLTHGARPAEFDTLDQLLKRVKTQQLFFVPGEHDTSLDDGKLYGARYGRSWYSFNHKDVHFIGLSNVGLQDGMGRLGGEQLAWLAEDLRSQPSSRPIVVFAHIPLWSVYPDWGWATSDSAEALTHLKRFGSVTVLNGHIHQVMQKVEGNITFHTAMSTAFPQPAPGTAKSPGPMKVEDDKLKSTLGITSVQAMAGSHSLALVDSPLG